MWYIDIPLFSLSLSLNKVGGSDKNDKNDKKNEKKGVKKKVSMMIKKRMNLSFMTKNEIVSNTPILFLSSLVVVVQLCSLCPTKNTN